MRITNLGIKTKIKEKYKKILNIFFPRDTRRRYILSLFKKSVLTFYKEGFKALLRKANKKILIRKKVFKENIHIIEIPSSVELYYIPNILPVKVSVIIHTKDPEEDIEYTLRKIKAQRGIKETEIIVVDSSSNEEAIGLVKKYTDKYFYIKPENLRNNDIRNLAFDTSSGRYLIFTVQDCIFISDTLFYNLLLPIVNKNIHALTVRKIPRIDADLFETWLIWQKYNFLNFSKDFIRNNRSFTDFESLDLRDKYRYSFLDNTCLVIDREVFDIYRFNSQYCEDIELGKKLLINGYNLMFVNSFAVIHSKNNDALHYFKMGCIESNSINRIFGVKPENRDINEVYNALEFLLKYFVIAMDKFEYIKNNDDNFIIRYLHYFENLVIGKTNFEDFSLESLFEYKLDRVYNFLSGREQSLNKDLFQYDNFMIKDFLDLYKDQVTSFNEYICNYMDINNNELSNDLSKLFCYSLGQYIGNSLVDIGLFKEL